MPETANSFCASCSETVASADNRHNRGLVHRSKQSELAGAKVENANYDPFLFIPICHPRIIDREMSTLPRIQKYQPLPPPFLSNEPTAVVRRLDAYDRPPHPVPLLKHASLLVLDFILASSFVLAVLHSQRSHPVPLNTLACYFSESISSSPPVCSHCFIYLFFTVPCTSQ